MPDFYQPDIFYGDAYECETTGGTQYVPADLLPGGTPTEVLWSALETFLFNPPRDPDTPPARITGWFGRLSAPGYLDCGSEWEPFDSEAEADECLNEMLHPL